LLIRITWALVALGAILLGIGFAASDQNILLILAIAVELAAIILVLATWARRAKDAADAYDEDLSYTGVSDDTEGDDDLLETFADEEFAVGGRTASRKPARSSRPKSTRSGSRKSGAAKSSPRSGSKPSARKPAARKSAAKPTKAKPTAKAKPTGKAKPTAKPKAKPAARKPAKPKPQRRRPTSE
jgi:hypothetical protein